MHFLLLLLIWLYTPPNITNYKLTSSNNPADQLRIIILEHAPHLSSHSESIIVQQHARSLRMRNGYYSAIRDRLHLAFDRFQTHYAGGIGQTTQIRR